LAPTFAQNRGPIAPKETPRGLEKGIYYYPILSPPIGRRDIPLVCR